MVRNDDALTAEDVAEILQVSRSSVYKLVKTDELASYYIGRKLRFTMSDVENYIGRSRKAKAREVEAAMGGAAHSAVQAGLALNASAHNPALGAAGAGLGARGAGAVRSADGAHARPIAPAPSARANVPCVLAGNDIVGDVLANYLGATGLSVDRMYEGSYNALVDVYRCRAHIGLAHLYDGATDSYNVEGVRRLLPGVPVRVVRMVRRRQGLIVAKGNPKNLRTWDDLLKPGVRLINRERGCGSRILLDEQLSRRGVDAAKRAKLEGYAREAQSGLAMASFVARGAADAGIGVERTFHQVEGVDFLPLQDEWLDVVLPKLPGYERVVEAVTSLTRTRPFREEIGNIVGYDASHMGEVVYES